MNNDPVNLIDPNGKFLLGLLGIIAYGLGTGIVGATGASTTAVIVGSIGAGIGVIAFAADVIGTAFGGTCP